MFLRSLAVKLIFFIAIVLILTIGIFAYINTSIQSKYLIGEMQQHAVGLSQTIEKSIEYDMLTARSDYIQRTLEDVGQQEGIERIRIFDKKGKIIAADSAEEIGISIDKHAEACYSCHSDREPLERLSTSDRTRIFMRENGNRVLGIVNPIYNEPQCYNGACHFHPKKQHVLGVMDILISLSRFDKQIGTNRNQIIIYLILTFLFISAGISLFIFIFVNTPIHKLIEGTRKVAGGDLGYRIGNYHSGEIGELNRSFDMMTDELKRSREEIEQWNLRLKNEVERATQRLKNTNVKLNDANKQLQELDDIKSDFMRRMEHGSRSHLAVVKSSLSLVLGEYYSEFNDHQRDLVETAERRCSTLLELLDDILLLSYRKSTKAVYNVESLQVIEIMQKIVGDIQDLARKKNIMIDVQIPLDFPPVLADREALIEVFSNLVNNAVKYTGEKGKITITAEEKKDCFEIDVSDTGIGIASKDLPLIFDELYRAPNAKSYKAEGTGVGLAIVKEIVEAHRGSLKVKSKLGKGSTFAVILPKKPTKTGIKAGIKSWGQA